MPVTFYFVMCKLQSAGEVHYHRTMNYQKQYMAMLKDEFELRQGFNKSYSLRAFARDIALAPQRLYLIFLGKQGLSHSSAQVLVDKLPWSPDEKNHFCDLVVAANARSRMEREAAEKRILNKIKACSHRKKLTEPQLRILSDWSCFSLLELTKTDDFQKDLDWISFRLQMPKNRIEESIDLLLTVGAIDKDTWKATETEFLTSDGVPSQSLRKLHRQMIFGALEAIEKQPLNERHLSSVITAAPASCLPEIFEKISKFRMELNEFIESKIEEHGASDVYCFSSQFYKLTNGE